ncbi:MAG TPA: hypothetical protein PLL36_11800 [Candidatus Hydrogenedentes bacterium]|nr:hypothetical protein [Candidatus Hydrogenedentota bacterium]
MDFGAAPYQPKEPINCVYDTWGAPAALIRGLFEYLYRAESLTLVPHIPTGITRLEQRFPIRFGTKRLYLSTAGTGPVTAVWINNVPWNDFDAGSITLPYERLPESARIQIALGGAALQEQPAMTEESPVLFPGPEDPLWDIEAFATEVTEKAASGCFGGKEPASLTPPVPFSRIGIFYNTLAQASLASSYEAHHARLICEYLTAIQKRAKMKSEGRITLLPEASQRAADRSYLEAAVRLVDGLQKTIAGYEGSQDAHKKRVSTIWKAVPQE